jgi:hypothetical protein
MPSHSSIVTPVPGSPPAHIYISIFNLLSDLTAPKLFQKILGISKSLKSSQISSE